jgi:ribosomal protein S8
VVLQHSWNSRSDDQLFARIFRHFRVREITSSSVIQSSAAPQRRLRPRRVTHNNIPIQKSRSSIEDLQVVKQPANSTGNLAMSLVTLSHVCSHLQNASHARLGMTSIPSTNLTLHIALALQKGGFIASVQRGSTNGPEEPPSPVTRQNVGTRRLWLGLKYWKNQPVLSQLKMVSKPTRRVWVGTEDLGKLIRGKNASLIKGLAPGEALLVSKEIGGQLLCRVK